MTAPAQTTQAQIKRALRAWIDCGLAVGGVEVTGATIRVLAPDTAKDLTSQPGGNTCDDIFNAGSG